MKGPKLLVVLSLASMVLACARPENAVTDGSKVSPFDPPRAELPAATPDPIGKTPTTPIPAPADAETNKGKPCDGVDTALTEARTKEYSQLVAGALKRKLKPASIDISNFMESGSWSAVYASTPISDPGVLFFNKVGDRKVFIDVWAGIAEEDDRPDIITWAEGIGAPAPIAQCFADTVVMAE